jgi:hypothetical protein
MLVLRLTCHCLCNIYRADMGDVLATYSRDCRALRCRYGTPGNFPALRRYLRGLGHGLVFFPPSSLLLSLPLLHSTRSRMRSLTLHHFLSSTWGPHANSTFMELLVPSPRVGAGLLHVVWPRRREDVAVDQSLVEKLGIGLECPPL